MTTSNAYRVDVRSSTRAGRARAATIASWALRIVLAAQFAVGGVLKLAADPQMTTMFDDIGGGPGLRVLVGVCEVAGAVGLLVPGLARWAAIGLAALMTGAVVTNVVILQTNPVLPLAFLALALIVVVTLRPARSER